MAWEEPIVHKVYYENITRDESETKGFREKIVIHLISWNGGRSAPVLEARRMFQRVGEDWRYAKAIGFDDSLLNVLEEKLPEILKNMEKVLVKRSKSKPPGS